MRDHHVHKCSCALSRIAFAPFGPLRPSCAGDYVIRNLAAASLNHLQSWRISTNSVLNMSSQRSHRASLWVFGWLTPKRRSYRIRARWWVVCTMRKLHFSHRHMQIPLCLLLAVVNKKAAAQLVACYPEIRKLFGNSTPLLVALGNSTCEFISSLGSREVRMSDMEEVIVEWWSAQSCTSIGTGLCHVRCSGCNS